MGKNNLPEKHAEKGGDHHAASAHSIVDVIGKPFVKAVNYVKDTGTKICKQFSKAVEKGHPIPISSGKHSGRIETHKGEKAATAHKAEKSHAGEGAARMTPRERADKGIKTYHDESSKRDYHYDKQGRVKEVHAANGTVSKIEYKGNGHDVAKIDMVNEKTGRAVIGRMDQKGDRTHLTVDQRTGDLTAVIRDNPSVVTEAHISPEGARSLVRRDNSGKRLDKSIYGPDGQPLSHLRYKHHVDKHGRDAGVTADQVDAQGRLAHRFRFADHNAVETQKPHERTDWRRSQGSGKEIETRDAYDLKGQKAEKTYHSQKTRDLAHGVTEVQEQRLRHGQVFQEKKSQFDRDGRPQRLSYRNMDNGIDAAFAFDKNGRPVEVVGKFGDQDAKRHKDELLQVAQHEIAATRLINPIRRITEEEVLAKSRPTEAREGDKANGVLAWRDGDKMVQARARDGKIYDSANRVIGTVKDNGDVTIGGARFNILRDGKYGAVFHGQGTDGERLDLCDSQSNGWELNGFFTNGRQKFVSVGSNLFKDGRYFGRVKNDGTMEFAADLKQREQDGTSLDKVLGGGWQFVGNDGGKDRKFEVAGGANGTIVLGKPGEAHGGELDVRYNMLIDRKTGQQVGTIDGVPAAGGAGSRDMQDARVVIDGRERMLSDYDGAVFDLKDASGRKMRGAVVGGAETQADGSRRPDTGGIIDLDKLLMQSTNRRNQANSAAQADETDAIKRQTLDLAVAQTKRDHQAIDAIFAAGKPADTAMLRDLKKMADLADNNELDSEARLKKAIDNPQHVLERVPAHADLKLRMQSQDGGSMVELHGSKGILRRGDTVVGNYDASRGTMVLLDEAGRPATARMSDKAFAGASMQLTYTGDDKKHHTASWINDGRQRLVSVDQMRKQVAQERAYAELCARGVIDPNSEPRQRLETTKRLEQNFDRTLNEIEANGVKGLSSEVDDHGRPLAHSVLSMLQLGPSQYVRAENFSALRQHPAFAERKQKGMDMPALGTAQDCKKVEGAIRLGHDHYYVTKGQVFQTLYKDNAWEPVGTPVGTLEPGYVLDFGGRKQSLAGREQVLFEFSADRNSDKKYRVVGGNSRLVDASELIADAEAARKSTQQASRLYRNSEGYVTLGVPDYLMGGRRNQLDLVASTVDHQKTAMGKQLDVLFDKGLHGADLSSGEMHHGVETLGRYANDLGLSTKDANELSDQGISMQKQSNDAVATVAMSVVPGGALRLGRVLEMGALGTTGIAATGGGVISVVTRETVGTTADERARNWAAGNFEGMASMVGQGSQKMLDETRLVSANILKPDNLRALASGPVLKAYAEPMLKELSIRGGSALAQTFAFGMSGAARTDDYSELTPGKLAQGTLLMMAGEALESTIGRKAIQKEFTHETELLWMRQAQNYAEHDAIRSFNAAFVNNSVNSFMVARPQAIEQEKQHIAAERGLDRSMVTDEVFERYKDQSRINAYLLNSVAEAGLISTISHPINSRLSGLINPHDVSTPPGHEGGEVLMHEGRPRRIVDAFGTEATLTYDDQGRLHSILARSNDQFDHLRRIQDGESWHIESVRLDGECTHTASARLDFKKGFSVGADGTISYTDRDGVTYAKRLHDRDFAETSTSAPELIVNHDKVTKMAESAQDFDSLVRATVSDLKARNHLDTAMDHFLERVATTDMPHEQFVEVMRHVNTALSLPDGTAMMSRHDRQRIAADLLLACAKPTYLVQEQRSTCLPTAAAARLLTVDPAQGARIVCEAMISGKVKMSDGAEIIVRSNEDLHHYDKDPTLSLLEHALIGAAYHDRTSYKGVDYAPGQIGYYKDRLVDITQPEPVPIEKTAGPKIRAIDLQKGYQRLTGDTSEFVLQNRLLARSEASVKDNNNIFASPYDLAERFLAQAHNKDGPLLLAVDASREPFLTDLGGYAGTASHMVSVIKIEFDDHMGHLPAKMPADFDPDHVYVTIDNQWGKDADNPFKKVRLSDLFQATKYDTDLDYLKYVEHQVGKYPNDPAYQLDLIHARYQNFGKGDLPSALLLEDTTNWIKAYRDRHPKGSYETLQELKEMQKAQWILDCIKKRESLEYPRDRVDDSAPESVRVSRIARRERPQTTSLDALAYDAHVVYPRHLERDRALFAEAQSARIKATTCEKTGVPNRLAFDQDMGRYIRQTALAGKEHFKPIVVTNIDLIDFGKVNKQFSHALGDVAIQQYSQQALALLKDNHIDATLYRPGGDEFVLVTHDVSQAEAAMRLLQNIRVVFRDNPAAETFTNALGQVVHKPDVLVYTDPERLADDHRRYHDGGRSGADVSRDLIVWPSMGGVTTRYGETMTQLAQRADIAMYANKTMLKAAKGTHVFTQASDIQMLDPYVGHIEPHVVTKDRRNKDDRRNDYDSTEQFKNDFEMREFYLNKLRVERLTNLPNDAETRKTLQQELDSLEAGQKLHIVRFSTDNFKQVNDRLDHSAGDEVLRFIGKYVSQGLDGQFHKSYKYGAIDGDPVIFVKNPQDFKHLQDVLDRTVYFVDKDGNVKTTGDTTKDVRIGFSHGALTLERHQPLDAQLKDLSTRLNDCKDQHEAEGRRDPREAPVHHYVPEINYDAARRIYFEHPDLAQLSDSGRLVLLKKHALLEHHKMLDPQIIGTFDRNITELKKQWADQNHQQAQIKKNSEPGLLSSSIIKAQRQLQLQSVMQDLGRQVGIDNVQLRVVGDNHLPGRARMAYDPGTGTFLIRQSDILKTNWLDAQYLYHEMIHAEQDVLMAKVELVDAARKAVSDQVKGIGMSPELHREMYIKEIDKYVDDLAQRARAAASDPGRQDARSRSLAFISDNLIKARDDGWFARNYNDQNDAFRARVLLNAIHNPVNVSAALYKVLVQESAFERNKPYLQDLDVFMEQILDKDLGRQKQIELFRYDLLDPKYDRDNSGPAKHEKAAIRKDLQKLVQDYQQDPLSHKDKLADRLHQILYRAMQEGRVQKERLAWKAYIGNAHELEANFIAQQFEKVARDNGAFRQQQPDKDRWGTRAHFANQNVDGTHDAAGRRLWHAETGGDPTPAHMVDLLQGLKDAYLHGQTDLDIAKVLDEIKDYEPHDEQLDILETVIIKDSASTKGRDGQPPEHRQSHGDIPSSITDHRQELDPGKTTGPSMHNLDPLNQAARDQAAKIEAQRLQKIEEAKKFRPGGPNNLGI
ncbi:MAG: diguanylate cyclase [Candidatus Melainabacteria bacterium]|nr:diguanylate cyclase [Candidatus Melainabacteria bacterium]